MSQDAGAGYPDDVANLQPAEGGQPFSRSVGGDDSFGLGSFTRQYTMVNCGGHHKGRTLRCECYPYGYGGKPFESPLEFIGAPESARLLNHSPSFWMNRLGEECAMAAAVNLQRDAGLMMSNLQILAQFVTSLHRMSSERMSIGVGHVVFPAEEVAKLPMTPRVQRAAKYMVAMGLWRPPSGPGSPGPLPTSTCASCMRCEYCFGGREPPIQ